MIFKVLINGEGFVFELDGATREVGFYTTLFINADKREQAEALALAAVKSDLVSNESKESRLNIESVETVKDIDATSGARTGYSFYLMEDELNDDQET